MTLKNISFLWEISGCGDIIIDILCRDVDIRNEGDANTNLDGDGGKVECRK